MERVKFGVSNGRNGYIQSIDITIKRSQFIFNVEYERLRKADQIRYNCIWVIG